MRLRPAIRQGRFAVDPPSQDFRPDGAGRAGGPVKTLVNPALSAHAARIPGNRRVAMTRAWIRNTARAAVVAALVMASGGAPGAQGTPSDKPDNPFKLATFEAGGKVRVGLVLGSRVL